MFALRWYRKQGLTARFIIASMPLVALFTFIGGAAVAAMAGRALVDHRAAASALLLHNLIQVNVENLIQADGRVSVNGSKMLADAMNDPVNSERFPYLEIWARDGTIIFSRNDWLIGKIYPLPEGAARSFEGEVVSDYSDLTAGVHADRNIASDFLEIYAPIYARNDGQKVVAVAETHEARTLMGAEIRRIQAGSYLLVASGSLVLLALLSFIVHAGQRTIQGQQTNLADHQMKLKQKSLELAALNERQLEAYRQMAAMNEKISRSIGADLHDGPAQVIGYSILRLDQLRRARSKSERDVLVAEIETHLGDCLGQIRATSRSLVLPEIEKMPATGVIRLAVTHHEKRTGMPVQLDMVDRAITLSPAENICLFRFVQEGLNNASVHAPGSDPSVRVDLKPDGITLTVHNSRGNPELTRPGDRRSGFGLQGLRHRIESLGGLLDFALEPGGGATLSMKLDLKS